MSHSIQGVRENMLSQTCYHNTMQKSLAHFFSVNSRFLYALQ